MNWQSIDPHRMAHVREQLERSRAIGEDHRRDLQIAQQRKGNRMPERTPQGDLNRRTLGLDGVTGDLDRLYDAAAGALDAANTAAERESQVNAANAARTANRFPAAGTGAMGRTGAGGRNG